MQWRLLAVLACVVAVCTSANPRRARAGGIRPLFEPTDLEMEETGVVELDLQFGGIRSRGPWRLVVPDFELDIGLLPYLELDIDGAYAVEGPSSGAFAFDHSVPDSLWPSLKLGLFDTHDEGTRHAWALGMHVGPKLPIAPGSHGVGVEGLLLLGYMAGRMHAALNLGGFADPAPDSASGRPVGIEAGLNLEVELGDEGQVSLLGAASGVGFVSDSPHQLLAMAGVNWAVLPMLDLSVMGLWGFLDGSDRYGVLVGVSPKFHLWRQ